MTALQVMLELLPPSHWDSQWWICPGHVSCMDAIGRVGSHWHYLTLVVVFRFSSAASSDEECLQNLSAVLSSGCCTWNLELCVKSLALRSRLLSCEFQLLLWLQWWDLCSWSSSDQFHWCSLRPFGLIKNSHCVLALYKSGRLNY